MCQKSGSPLYVQTEYINTWVLGAEHPHFIYINLREVKIYKYKSWGFLLLIFMEYRAVWHAVQTQSILLSQKNFAVILHREDKKQTAWD